VLRILNEIHFYFLIIWSSSVSFTLSSPSDFQGANVPSWPGLPQYWGFTITHRNHILGKSPLDEWSARRRNVYLTNTQHSQEKNIIPPEGFEPTVPANEFNKLYTTIATIYCTPWCWLIRPKTWRIWWLLLCYCNSNNAFVVLNYSNAWNGKCEILCWCFVRQF
jgi:hypothetical protein